MAKTHDSINKRCRTRHPLSFSHKVFLFCYFLLFIGLTLPFDGRIIRSLHALQIDDPNIDSSDSSSIGQSSNLTVSENDEPRLSKLNETLRIAWLLSFPNSGTSFTMKNLRHSAMVQSATNYGHENYAHSIGESVPVFEDQPGGPFWMDPDVHPEYHFPRSFVVAKTHCGGRCVDCPPSRYLETIGTFKLQCLIGKRRVHIGSQQFENQDTSYSMDRVAKAIHLIREPFSNVVSRFHMEIKGGRSGEGLTSSKDDFRRFCSNLNQKYEDDETRSVFLETEILQALKNVPCRADFLRWLEWHNHAFAMASDTNLDVLVVHYEDYMTDMPQATSKLLKFLELPQRGDAHTFVSGKTYHDFFTVEEKRAVHLAFRKLSTSRTWSHIEHYFRLNL